MTQDARSWARAKDELLAALELEPEARDERLRALSDENPELAEQVRMLIAGAESPGDFLAAPALEALAPPVPSAAAADRVGPWRLESEIGHGGMGTVWRAHRDDGAFEQTVAVKFVRPELATDLMRRRLVAERRILASLEHEGIARLLDGGVTADGVPFLVLEFVDGEPIDRWCDRRALPANDRLRLFLAVCSAVEFAHRKLVLHRDIKSSNVLVDERGKPKLLDFGIASLLGPEPAGEDWTALGLARPLTPEWASPEQLRGEVLTTASDVYSLGVLLCALLTGERPYRWTGQAPEQLAREIEESGGAPVHGLLRRSLAPGVAGRLLRGDLERVLAKALAAEPERRYGSAAELAADVERFLDGRPVSAHVSSVGYRLQKFVRRNRAGVAAAALVVLSLLAGIVATAHEARVAEGERARAERRFDDVRKLANVMLFDVAGSLDKVSGAMATRRLLLDSALSYLDDLAREAGDEPALLAELARAYERVGEMQGLPGWQSEGRTGDALASFEKSLELERRVRTLGAASAAGELAEARLLLRIGSVLAARGDPAGALVRHREALALLQDPARTAHAPAADLELAQALVAVGDDTWELGDVPAAAVRYGEAQVAARAASAAAPDDLAAIREVGVVEQRLGDAAAHGGDWPQALEHHAASLAVDRDLAGRRPEDIEFQRDLGTDLSRLAVIQTMHGAAEAALVTHHEAIKVRAALVADDPRDARAGDDLAESTWELAKTYAALGRTAEARAAIADAVEQRRALAARDPANARWSDSLASTLATRAELETVAGDRNAARATLGEVLAIRRRLAADSPDLSGNIEALAEVERRQRELG